MNVILIVKEFFVYLQKVFPELRDEMEPMGIQIIDCDLRWGVSELNLSQNDVPKTLDRYSLCLGTQRFDNRTNHLNMSRRNRSMY